MKQFIKDKKITYNLMSYTGYKSLIVFALLLESPKSLNEVNEYFIKHPYIREAISIDTLRVYLNSFKAVGCDIKRVKGEDKISRYTILSHPFELSIPEEELPSIVKVYKNIAKNLSVENSFQLEHFLEKIAGIIENEAFAEEIQKVSIFKDINKDVLKELIDCCNKKDQIVINYKSPNSGEKDIEIIADKLELTNGKIYLYGTGFEYGQYSSFLVSRIVKIKEIKLEHTIPLNLHELTVKYELETEPQLEKYEKIIEKCDNKFIIEATISNTFLFKQRLLEYGPVCKILEPENFKNEFITLLKDMKAGYYCE